MNLKLNNKILIIILPIVLGIFTSFSLPPYNFLVINFLTFPTLLLLIINNCKKKINKFFIGTIFGFSYFLSNLYWITHSLTFDDNFKIFIPFALIIIPLFLGLFYGLACLIIAFFNIKKDFSTILIFSTIFSLIEFLRSFILGGFPWNLIAYSWTNYLSFLQIISSVGTYAFNLLSITIFLFPFIFFFKINYKSKFLITLFLSFLLISNQIYGKWKVSELESKNKIDLGFTIKVISPKIDIKRFLDFNDAEKTLNELVLLSKPNYSEKTIFIFPEGILSGIFLQDLKNYNDLFLDNYSKYHKIILGINSYENIDGINRIFNSLVTLDNKGNIINKYYKNKLVPFGEFLPMESFFNKFGLKKITSGYQSFSAGTKRNIINIYDKKFIPLICYEIIYSGKIKKNNQNIDFILNISEDGWFGNSIGPYQHFSHSIFRAIEEGKNLIRSGNNGISSFISPVGKPIGKIESTKKGVIEIKNFHPGQKTFFGNHGNKIFFYFIIIYISLIFFLKKKGG